MAVVSMRERPLGFGSKGWANVDWQAASVQTLPPDEAEGMPVGGNSNRARFAELVLPHLKQAFSLARWITGNRADAEDVVQEASLRAFAAIGNVTHRNGRAWTLTIVRNTANTWLRKNRPASLLMVDDLEAVEIAAADPATQDSETPETALIAKTDAERLQAAIAALPVVYRETLILRDVEGLSYREIADITGVPVGTVMSRLARGRDQVIKSIGRKSS